MVVSADAQQDVVLFNTQFCITPTVASSIGEFRGFSKLAKLAYVEPQFNAASLSNRTYGFCEAQFLRQFFAD